MVWQNVTILLARDEADAFGDALMEAGAISVNVEDADEGTHMEKPIFGEPGAHAGLWEQCRLSVLFAPEVDVGVAMQTAAETLDCPLPEFHIAPLDDVDWVAKNREQFQPIRISDAVWIVPTWHEAPDTKAVNIVLDPGAAFGTGSHPTTRLCLLWLEETVPLRPQQTVIDYGCGSGILAIAAKKFGAGPTIGVDIDPQAIEAAIYNAQQNEESIDFLVSDQAFNGKADIVVANILANPLRILAPLLAAHTRLGGNLALAGILDSQAEEIIDIYRPWFHLRVWRSEEGWSCLAGSRLES